MRKKSSARRRWFRHVGQSVPRKHLDVLGEALNRRIEMIPPVVKRLACGDVGAGAMAPVDEIVER